MQKVIAIFIGIGLATPQIALADTVPTVPPLVKKHDYSDVNFSGYIDGSYSRVVRNEFTSGTYDRAFDVVPSGLTLHQAAITLAYQPEGFGGLLNLIAGQDAEFIAPYGFQPTTEFDSETIAVDFTQAFLQYKRGPATLMLGRYLSTNGSESLNPTLDTNFSRSILYYTTPYTFTGIRGLYNLNDKWSFIAGLNNGPDNIRDWSRRKTVELGFTFIMNPKFTFAAVAYNGQERATSGTDFGPLGNRTLIDLVGTFNATDKLTLIANYDYTTQSKAALPDGSLSRAVWQGIAGYVNYQFNEKWLSSLRGEVFEDSDGFKTGVRQNWREVTLTLGYIPIKNAMIHAEIRRDFSNVSSFTNSSGVTTSNNNQSFALEGYYKFA